MAFITLRQANVVNSPNATIKASPLTNSEVDNNFANLNVSLSSVENTTYVLSTIDNTTTINANLIPLSNVEYDLGNATNRFRDLYLSGNSINLGGLTIGLSSTGNLLFNGNVIATPEGFIAGNINAEFAVADNSISAAKLQNDSVTTDKIENFNVTTAKIASNAITDVKILDGNVTTSKLINGAVTEAKIADGNVTTSKLSVTGVGASTYGGGTQVPVFTVGVDGRITTAANSDLGTTFSSVGKAIGIAIVFG